MPSVTTPLLSVRAADIETVSVRNPGAPTALSGVHGLRRAISTREVAASLGKYTQSDLVWQIPTSELPNFIPLLGAVITDASSQRWTVLDAALQTRSTRWRFTTRNLAVAHGLNSVCTIQKAKYVKQDSGDAQPQWHDWLAGQKCRIQLQATQAGVHHDLRLSPYTYRIYLEQQPPEPLGNQHRIVAADGTIYKISGFSAPDTITDWYQISAQQIPFPFAS